MVVTKRGVSPRIVGAKLYGTGGVTKISGEQLEVALGGYDTWMTFQKIVDGQPKGPLADCQHPDHGRRAPDGLTAQPSG